MASSSSDSGPSADGVSKMVHAEAPDPYATVAQFSFAPATQTTVVTTTYTTTTTFPPLCVNAPGSLAGRDPKDYPLAHVQAPESIRKFYFESGGELACFEEADAASERVQEVRFHRFQGYACSRGFSRYSCERHHLLSHHVLN
jgi:F-box and WD-40 domain protein CDC4